MSILEICLYYWLGANLASIGAFIVGSRTGGGSVVSAVLCGMFWPFVLFWLLVRFSEILIERIFAVATQRTEPTQAHSQKKR
jgi:hypothetical protein